MTKKEALDQIKLLLTLESWARSSKTALPDYLRAAIARAMETLEKIVLGTKD